jgi:hypothetical protein
MSGTSHYSLPEWWPLDLSDRALSAVASFSARMRTAPVDFDGAGAIRTLEIITGVMRSHVEEIVDRDGMPHLAHVINGWGNGRLRGRRLLEHFSQFIHRDGDDHPYILQCDTEGDFHPWQGFAYAVMAGLDLGQVIPGTAVSLAEVARNSVYLQTDVGREMGHLLYGLAHLESKADDVRPFSLSGRTFTVREVMEHAVTAHVEGDFKTCKKIHLTEGICAAAARIDGLADYRGEAEAFLTGQLEQLHVLGVFLEQARLIHGGESIDQTLIDELRTALVLDRWFENLIWQAGHLAELAELAALLGYSIPIEQRRSLTLVINEVNALIPAFLPHIDFARHFLVFGHYRRGVTLMLARERASAQQPEIDLAAFTVDFDDVAPISLDTSQQVPSGVFDLYLDPHSSRAEFAEVVARYAASARPGLEPRGRADHFRRIGPPSWPRALHYELLDYGDQIGVELHLESSAVRPLGPALEKLVAKVAARFVDRSVEWDPAWWRQSGRLRIQFGREVPAADIAAAMHVLIDATWTVVDAFGRGAQVAAGASTPVDLSEVH